MKIEWFGTPEGASGIFPETMKIVCSGANEGESQNLAKIMKIKSVGAPWWGHPEPSKKHLNLEGFAAPEGEPRNLRKCMKIEPFGAPDGGAQNLPKKYENQSEPLMGARGTFRKLMKMEQI